MLDLLSCLPRGAKVAIGGGDPLSHPEFLDLVRGLASMGIVPSVTVNGMHLRRHRPLLERLVAKKAVYGVGVSFAGSLPDWDYEHLVLHMVAGVDNPAVLQGAPRRKVLVLGYKDFGRGAGYKGRHGTKMNEMVARWRREILWLAHAHHLSFDTLAISQLEPRRLFRSEASYLRRHMGDEGMFSMYLDGVRQEFAASSYSTERLPWSDLRTMFRMVREDRMEAAPTPG